MQRTAFIASLPSSTETVQGISQQQAHPATPDLFFGGDKEGTFGSPVDPMHQFLEGILKCAICVCIDGLNTENKAKGDDQGDNAADPGEEEPEPGAGNNMDNTDDAPDGAARSRRGRA